MRIVVAIPHFFGASSKVPHGALRESPAQRARKLATTIDRFRRSCSHKAYQTVLNEARYEPADTYTLASTVDFVVCVTGTHHALGTVAGKLGKRVSIHRTTCRPELLGYECQDVLRSLVGTYDLYCYVEDDLYVIDPWFVEKLKYFNSTANECEVLLPHRFEVSSRSASRIYIDGAIPSTLRSAMKVGQSRMLDVCGVEIPFVPPSNPHSGCFFLTESQLRFWCGHACFLDYSTSFYSGLESAATFGLMRALYIYKSDLRFASFFSIQHAGTRISDRIEARNGFAPW